MNDKRNEGRCVYQYDFQRELVQKFASLHEASRISGVSVGTIRYYANSLTEEGAGHKRRSWKSQYIWSYTEDVEPEIVERVISGLRVVYKFNKEGDVVKVYSGISELATDLGEKHATVWKRLFSRGTFKKGEYEYSRSKHRPSIPLKREKPRPICGQSTSTEECVFFETIIEASRSLHISRETISSALHGKREEAGGYTWTFRDFNP